MAKKNAKPNFPQANTVTTTMCNTERNKTITLIVLNVLAILCLIVGVVLLTLGITHNDTAVTVIGVILFVVSIAQLILSFRYVYPNEKQSCIAV